MIGVMPPAPEGAEDLDTFLVRTYVFAFVIVGKIEARAHPH